MGHNKGWIKIFRGVLEDEIWDNDEPKDSFSAFMYLLLKANHRSASVYGRQVSRGQHWTSINKLARALNRDKRTVKRMLNNMQADEKITYQQVGKGLLISITNYDVYQSKNNNLSVVYTTDSTTDTTTNSTTDNATDTTTQTRMIKNEYKEV